MLGALVLGGTTNLWVPLAVATAGNTLGAVVSWAFGRYAARWRDEATFERACRLIGKAARYGVILFALA